MQRMKAGLRISAAVAAILALSGGAGFAKEDSGATEIVPIQSFSGAYLAARVAETDNDLDSAVAYYKRALTFDAENLMLQRRLLRALVAQGELTEALPYASELTEDEEASRLARLVLAIDAFRKHDYGEAETWLEVAADSDLDRLITETMTAWAKIGQDDINAGLEVLDGLTQPEWFSPFRDYQRALVYAFNKQDAEATQAFEKLFSGAQNAMSAETFARVVEAYASFLSNRGKKDEALAILNRTIDAGLGITPIPVLRERIEDGETLDFIVDGPAAGAAEVLLSVATELASGGGDSFVQLYLHLYLHYGLALQPDSDPILIQLARVAERLQQAEKAIEYYERIEPTSAWARLAEFQIGLNLADLDRNEEAVSHLKEVLDADPTDIRAYLALGRVYSAQEDFKSAAELYDQAVEVIGEPEPQHWNIYYQRGISYERIKEWPKAEPNFKKALELYPDHPQVLNYLGYSWIDMNINLEEGMDLIRRAVELRPSDGYIVDSLGWAHYKLGEYEEAVEHLERAVSLRPEDPVLNDHLGDGYWRTGRKLEAIYQWSHALGLEPDDALKAAVEEKLENGLPEPEPKKVANASGIAGNVMSDGARASEQKAREDKPAAEPVEEAPAAEPQEDAPEAPADVEEEANEPAAIEEEPAQPAAVERENKAEPAAYTVKPGQSLWSIAAEELGSGDRFREILRLNPALSNPNAIYPGLELKMPNAE